MAKVDLFPDFKDLLDALNKHRVEYLVLGGYAVIHYGYHRTTGDLDVWIAANDANAVKVSNALQEWGAFSADTVPPRMFSEVGAMYSMGVEPVQLDILTSPSGLEFGECYSRRNEVEWDGIIVPLISREDLRLNKRASGRSKDLADLQYLPSVPVDFREKP